MASRSMHLALSQEIAKLVEIKDINRFRLGSILPDAYGQGLNTAISHLKIRLFDQNKITYRLSYFREVYCYELESDDLYLGYYMHLIQDLFYRNFVYEKYHWNPTIEGNIEKIHNDYRLINTYVIEKYKITNELTIPDGIQKERLFELYPFDLNELSINFHSDFVPYCKGKEFFFTRAMADEYIQSSVRKCADEITALRNHSYHIDEMVYAWNLNYTSST